MFCAEDEIIRALTNFNENPDIHAVLVQLPLPEIWYRYVVDVLTDAQVYSEHASKDTIEPDDIKLAILSKGNFSFSQPPPREVLLELAKNRNKIPLPKNSGGPGIPLPPEEDTLITPNYQLVIPAKQTTQALEENEDDSTAPSSSQEPKG